MRHEKRLLRAIKARGGSVSTVGSRSLLSRLAVDLGMVCKESDVEATLLVLEAKGQVTIERMAGENSPIRSVVIKAYAPKHKPKRKSTKPTLNEPAQIVRPVPIEEGESVMTDKRTLVQLAPTKAERLTLCLTALQLRATPDGEIDGSVARKALVEDLNLTPRAAERALDQLGEAGFRTSRATGFQKRTHTVRMDVREITDQMINKPKGDPVSTTEVSVPGEPVEPVVGVVPQLLAIIERLESELADAASSLERGVLVVDRLQAENEQLRRQLEAQTAQSAKAAEVIKKYRPKS